MDESSTDRLKEDTGTNWWEEEKEPRKTQTTKTNNKETTSTESKRVNKGHATRWRATKLVNDGVVVSVASPHRFFPYTSRLMAGQWK